jgi:hypothetical protein
MAPEDAERAVHLYESGLTVEEVVRQVGYSFGTIRKVLHEHGVAMRVRVKWHQMSDRSRR